MNEKFEWKKSTWGRHSSSYVNDHKVIYLSWFLRKYISTAKSHESKDFCPLFPGESLCTLHAASAHSCFSQVRLFVTPRAVARQAPLSMGILQARILEWVAMPPLGDLPNAGIEPTFPASLAWQADSLPLSHWRNPRSTLCYYSLVAQLCLTLCNPMNYSTPGLCSA